MNKIQRLNSHILAH